ncbi:hypothetical protein ASPACDRAFT_125025 [Aspergillus aculeatus ATCC 16872]|uniref:Transaldolase n=1 Tax=Aspergillus aculeatus (strain ATCC 16872 / CBS 172.66 / WB 5094) TaxID=690307 RepID=A0A1L9WJU7_ASPA1|nr:uncharacterized protein ASPACDRAFT_125025 [Aspergillus aculeatus ATCC 16872]OJJ96423.1 hypothetical protein ASPACDRAFT_125025 [Aspergillus aculeatus ATCC 16872]
MVGTTVSPSWLDRLEDQVNVDVDWMDPVFIQSLPITPHDMTSNQVHVHAQLENPIHQDLIAEVAREYKGRDWLSIYTRIAVLLCKKSIDHISGRVLLQVSPSEAYNGEKVLEHARLYAKEFESVGISKHRFCIKIPSTGPALSVCPILQAEGIQTLGTACFSLAQAIAASQAGCLFISPYYNELRANLDLSLWPNVEDPATQHPFSARLVHMLETYCRLYKETGKRQPLIKNANFISAKEAFAQGEIGVDSATVSKEVLEELARLPYDGTWQPGVGGVPKPQYPEHQNTVATPKRLQYLASIDPLVASWDGKLASTDTDYLANNGVALEDAIKADPIATARLGDALQLFIKVESQSKVLIEKAILDV